jgi:hypothetical protein
MELSQTPVVNQSIDLGSYDLHLKGPLIDADASARFFFSYQNEPSVWAELTPKGRLSILQHDIEATSQGKLHPFPVTLSGPISKQTSGGPATND